MSEVFDTIRQDFVNTFDQVVSFCCSLEVSKSSLKVSNHLHCFMEFAEDILLEELRDYIVCCFPDDHLDLQPCRSRRSCLKYISKEDINLYTNVKTSDLNFNYQVFKWASSIDRFRCDHPFVVMHRFCYRYLQNYYNDFLRSQIKEFVRFNRVEVSFLNWAMLVAEWWNSVISCFVVKRKCLYLYGNSDVGKSAYVERVIGFHNLKYVFYPGVGKFFMQDYDEKVHKVIVFEEFDYKFVLTSHLKRLLEGRPYAYSVKGLSDRMICFTGPIIFISNFNEINDDAIRNRLLFVSADVPYWQGIEANVPKAEVHQEVYEVSSDEEGL